MKKEEKETCLSPMTEAMNSERKRQILSVFETGILI